MNAATRLYLANTALLIAHEIDSAYWKEWELFTFRVESNFSSS